MVPENRKLSILEAAHKLFSHYGFEKTTIEDIAKEAGPGKGTIYLEFDSKDSILMAIISNFIEAELAEIYNYLASLKLAMSQGKAPKGLIKHTKKLFLDHILRTYDIATGQLHSAEALVHTSNKVRSGFEEFFTRKHNMLAELLELAANLGEFKKYKDYHYRASLIMKGICGLMPPYNPHINAEGKLASMSRSELETYARDLLEILFTCT